MKVIVTGYEPVGVLDTVVVFHGLHEKVGEVRFAVDHRLAAPLIDAIGRQEDPVAILESWQVLSS